MGKYEHERVVKGITEVGGKVEIEQRSPKGEGEEGEGKKGTTTADERVVLMARVIIFRECCLKVPRPKETTLAVCLLGERCQRTG